MYEPYPHLHRSLAELDEDTLRVIDFEKRRQERKIILIASESICPKAVLEAEASVFSNLYAEGYPPASMVSGKEREQVLDFEKNLASQRRDGDRRHYQGCDYANFIEALAQYRATQVFAHSDGNITIKPEDIFVNVQPLSGAAANNAVYYAFVEPGDPVMGLALPHGGHLTHGSQFNRSGKLHKVVSYEIDLKTGRIDYEQAAKLAHEHRPKLLIAGASAYPWDIDWKLLRKIADDVGAILLADIAHPAGLVAAGLFPNPVGYAHVTTLTMHKTMCGPRSAIILSTDKKIAARLDKAVFPGEQGGPHINTIAGVAVALKLAKMPEFRALMKRVVDNAVALADGLTKRGFKLVYGGTNTHLCLVDLREIRTASGVQLKGDVAAKILDLCGITCNKNTIPGDVTAGDSSAIRLGTTWSSQLGMGQAEMDTLAGIIHKTLTNINTYQVETNKSTQRKGKLALEVMHEVREQVDGLVHRSEHPDYPVYPHYYRPYAIPRSAYLSATNKPVTLGSNGVERNGMSLLSYCDNAASEWKAAQENAVWIHHVEGGLLEISGKDAENFLGEAITGNIGALEEGKGLRTLLLSRNGQLIDDVVLWRLPQEKEDKQSGARFWLSTNPHARENVKEWLRALSDGYVLCDSEAPGTTLPGPVMVRDLAESIPVITSLLLVGPQANGIVAKLNSCPIVNYTLQKVEWQHITLWIAKTDTDEHHALYSIYIAQEHLPKLVEAIGSSAVQSGQIIIDNLRQQAGLPLDLTQAQQLTPASLYQKFSACFSSNKPYFIGWAAYREVFASAAADKNAKEVHVFKTYDGEPRYTALAQEHPKITERALVPFAGWWMPVLYSSILEEHKVVREKVALFDVTHMGVVDIAGKGASRFLNLITTNEVEKCKIGQSQYSYLLNPDGSVIDDILIYRRSKDNFMLVINASNAEKDIAWMKAVASRQVVIDQELSLHEVDAVPVIRDLKAQESGSDRKVDIALQGPRSLELLKILAGDDDGLKRKLETLLKSNFIEANLAGIPLFISRTGYTGEEFGYELYVHPDAAPVLWNLLLDKGKPLGIQATGLGARDSTRTEVGFPLYGHELAGAMDIDPIEAGYGAFVKFNKPFFIGKKALLAKHKNSSSQIVRFEIEGTGIRAVRPGAIVVNRQGQVIGKVTSCTFTSNKQVGMAYVDKSCSTIGTQLGIINQPQGKRAAQAKAISDYKIGDTIPVPETATVVSRFVRS